MTQFNFCPWCATSLGRSTRGGRERPTCESCGYIQYRNPVVGVAIVLFEHGRLLLGRRAFGQDRAGLWCIPCGYVEWGEDIREAARREFLEETGLDVQPGDIFAVHSNFHNPTALTVGIWFRGTVVGGNLEAADDLDLVGFFDPANLPGDLAFPTDVLVISQAQRELQDLKS